MAGTAENNAENVADELETQFITILFNEKELDNFFKLPSHIQQNYVKCFCKELFNFYTDNLNPSECLNPDCFDDSEDYNMVLYDRRYTHIHQLVYINNNKLIHTPPQEQSCNVNLPFCLICSLKYLNVKIAPNQDYIFSSMRNAKNKPFIKNEWLDDIELVLKYNNELPIFQIYNNPDDFILFMSRAYSFWRGVDHWRKNDWCKILKSCHQIAITKICPPQNTEK